METTWLLPAGLVTLLALSACNHGDKGLIGVSAETIEISLASGQTTQSQALARFGAPRTRASNNLGEFWTYALWKDTPPESPLAYMPLIQFASMSSSNATKALTLHFDQAGLLQDWDYEETYVPHYTGL